MRFLKPSGKNYGSPMGCMCSNGKLHSSARGNVTDCNRCGCACGKGKDNRNANSESAANSNTMW